MFACEIYAYGHDKKTCLHLYRRSFFMYRCHPAFRFPPAKHGFRLLFVIFLVQHVVYFNTECIHLGQTHKNGSVQEPVFLLYFPDNL